MTRPLLVTGDTRPVHFVGIAGAGMSALAELLDRRGVAVQGTDANASGAPDLAALGIRVSAHDASLVTAARALVYSSAIPQDHPEMQAARRLGIPVVRRAEALAQAVSGGTLVGIAGTHGKTTTTVMTTEALAAAGRDPTGVVGGRVGMWGGNLRLGGAGASADATPIADATYVVEADEYDRSFLALAPTVAVVLNLEADHLDIYRDLADIREAFEQFVAPARVVVRCADDVGAMSMRVAATRVDGRASAATVGTTSVREIISYSATLSGESARDARLVATGLRMDATGAHFGVAFDGQSAGDVALAVPGLHNVRNALAALGAGLAIGCAVSDMAPGLAAFRGVERRFQRVGTARDVAIVDDYAHHPTEVAATIAAARIAFPGRRLLVAFQPHLYSRTRDLHAAFASALGEADRVYLCDIYGAREADPGDVTSALIGDEIDQRVVAWRGPRSEVASALATDCLPGDVVITMGAGDVTRASTELFALLGA